MTKLYFCPTFHPAGEQNLLAMSKEYEIYFYNYFKNERGHINGLDYPYVDLNLPKIVIKRLDFAITNTLAIARLILRKKPEAIVTEDFLFALPYMLAGKWAGTRLIYYNCSSGPSATRVKNRVVHWVKAAILRQFDEYWHGFDGAEGYIAQYVNRPSKLVPWVKLDRREVRALSTPALSGIYVGEFSKRKRIDYVLDLERSANGSEITYKLVGAAPDSPYYQDQYKRLDRAAALDHMQDAHFLCLLSEREAMGAVVFEALACGAFVVLSHEIGANKIVQRLESEADLPAGILHFNQLGCIVDTAQITPEALNAFLVSRADDIRDHRNERAQAVEDYLV